MKDTWPEPYTASVYTHSSLAFTSPMLLDILTQGWGGLGGWCDVIPWANSDSGLIGAREGELSVQVRLDALALGFSRRAYLSLAVLS
jgi:hypothetical protein